MPSETQPTENHWESYYKSGQVPEVPSQFAVFVLNECPQTKSILEIGCGNGRDSLFFAQQNLKVFAVDRSDAAVEICRTRARAHQFNAKFEVCDLNDEARLNHIINVAETQLVGEAIVYSRFFIHAIDTELESRFLMAAEKVLSNRNGTLAVEFRTQRDKDKEKVTPDHFRRFVDPIEFANRASKYGFVCNYFVEGFGLAKYKSDDAHVARLLFGRD